MDLPYNWEARLDKKTGKLYFVDHNTRTTSWADPRPLPAGWEKRVEPRTKREFFVNHLQRSTTWEDPRPRPVINKRYPLANPSSAYPNIAATKSNTPISFTQARYQSVETSALSASAPSAPEEPGYDKTNESHSMYMRVLKLAIQDGKISADEDKLLRGLRKEANIGDDEFEQILRELGLSQADYDALREKGPTATCCVCLDAPASHIILNCMHLCLCEDCSPMIAASGKCPNCRSPVSEIVKAYM